MGIPITEDEFAGMFSTFRESAFRLETREQYAITSERDAFARFLGGHPLPPSELDWWQEWLNGMRELTRAGKRIGRVRVLSEPPSDYQRWEMWGTAWHAEAGEEIRYMSRLAALALSIPLDSDWWLFDDERLVIMKFTDEDEIDGQILVTEPPIVAEHRRLRDLATRHAAPAESFAAA